MSAPATQDFDSKAKPADTGMAVAWDNAFAQLAGDRSGSAFHQDTETAQTITDQHVAVGNLPNLVITGNDLTAAV